MTNLSYRKYILNEIKMVQWLWIRVKQESIASLIFGWEGGEKVLDLVFYAFP